MSQEKRKTKPIRIHTDWHKALKLEAVEQNTSISKIAEKLFTDHFRQATK